MLFDNRKVDGFLLDMDGTLLDTETVYVQSMSAALAAQGHRETRELCHSLIGIPGPDCESSFYDHFGSSFSIDEYRRDFAVQREILLRNGIPLKPHALEFLTALQRTCKPLALVTSSSRGTAERLLGLAGLNVYFDLVVTRDDVSKSKPAPDLYLLAAQLLALNPSECLVVEDSVPGVDAAYSAGAAVFMVPDVLEPKEDTRSKCIAVLSSLKSVLECWVELGILSR